MTEPASPAVSIAVEAFQQLLWAERQVERLEAKLRERLARVPDAEVKTYYRITKKLSDHE